MFDIGWTELVIVGIVALIVIGPRELPATLRTLGQFMTKVRRMASEFQGQFQDAIREAELDELRKEAEKLTSDASAATSFEPLEKAKKEIQSAIDAPATSKPAADTAEPTAPDTKPTEPPADPAVSGGGRAA